MGQLALIKQKMPKRIDISTDIAIIGVWDPTHERYDLISANPYDFKSELQMEALEARLFFIDTFADGNYPTDIYINEIPHRDILAHYLAVEREFLILSESGHLIAGGIEDFYKVRKQTISDGDQFDVSPGLYAIKFYERMEGALIKHIGEKELNYYENKFADSFLGCLIFVIMIGFLVSKLWYFSASLFVIWLIYLAIRFRIRATDQRFQGIRKRITTFENQYPPFIYVFRRIADAENLKGGWHRLG